MLHDFQDRLVTYQKILFFSICMMLRVRTAAFGVHGMQQLLFF